MAKLPQAASPIRDEHDGALARVRIGQDVFEARFRDDVAPAACARIRGLLPLRGELIHARWCGEACWLPLGDLELKLAAEPVVHAPEPGDVLVYPGGISETEILIAYGPTRFACAAGELAGDPVLKIVADLDRLSELGREISRRGAGELEISLAAQERPEKSAQGRDPE